MPCCDPEIAEAENRSTSDCETWRTDCEICRTDSATWIVKFGGWIVKLAGRIVKLVLRNFKMVLWNPEVRLWNSETRLWNGKILKFVFWNSRQIVKLGEGLWNLYCETLKIDHETLRWECDSQCKRSSFNIERSPTACSSWCNRIVKRCKPFNAAENAREDLRTWHQGK